MEKGKKGKREKGKKGRREEGKEGREKGKKKFALALLKFCYSNVICEKEWKNKPWTSSKLAGPKTNLFLLL